MTENEIPIPLTFPRYKSHKTVEALKILDLKIRPDGSASIETDDISSSNPSIRFILACEGWADRFKGDENDLGYWVRYADGYQSWSPSEAFEGGYTRELSEEEEIELEIQAKDLNAPRLTPKKIDETILGEQYHVFPETTVTVCCLTLRNGFCVIGKSAAASPENFNVDIGMKVARQNARREIWELEGYLLRHQLHQIDIIRKMEAAEASTRRDREGDQ